MKTSKSLGIFKDLEDISILYQYMYVSESRVKFNNGIADVEIWMDKDLHVMFKLSEYNDDLAINYGDMLFPNQLLGIIDILKSEFADTSLEVTKWDVIRLEVATIKALNDNKR